MTPYKAGFTQNPVYGYGPVTTPLRMCEAFPQPNAYRNVSDFSRSYGKDKMNLSFPDFHKNAVHQRSSVHGNGSCDRCCYNEKSMALAGM